MLSNESLTQESAETGLPSESCQLLDSHVHNEGGLYDRMAADADNGSSDVAPKSINSLADLARRSAIDGRSDSMHND